MTIPSAGKSVLPVVKLNVGPDASATLKVFKSIGVFTGQLSSRANPKEIMYEEVFQLNSFLCG